MEIWNYNFETDKCAWSHMNISEVRWHCDSTMFHTQTRTSARTRIPHSEYSAIWYVEPYSQYGIVYYRSYVCQPYSPNSNRVNQIENNRAVRVHVCEGGKSLQRSEQRLEIIDCAYIRYHDAWSLKCHHVKNTRCARVTSIIYLKCCTTHSIHNTSILIWACIICK